jgi:hypothetical protein
VNFNQGKLDYYNENPDQRIGASQRNVVAEKQTQKQEPENKKAAKQENKKGRKVA